MLQRTPDLAGIWGTNLYGIQGAITALAEAGLSDQVTVLAPDLRLLELARLLSGGNVLAGLDDVGGGQHLHELLARGGA